MRSLNSSIRSRIRATLIAHGPQTCSEIVRGMGLDPRRHKGTIHAIMVDMEKEQILDATRSDNGKRDLWFINGDQIRFRDRIRAAFM